MPSVRKLSVEEVKSVEEKGLSQRAKTAAEYDAFVADLVTGDYIEVTPDGESKPTIRHQFNAAAQRAGVEIKWLRGKSSTLKFKVEHSPFESVGEDDGKGLESFELPVSNTLHVNADHNGGEYEAERMTADAMELPELEEEEVVQPVQVAPKRPRRNSSKITDTEVFVEAP